MTRILVTDLINSLRPLLVMSSCAFDLTAGQFDDNSQTSHVVYSFTVGMSSLQASVANEQLGSELHPHQVQL